MALVANYGSDESDLSEQEDEEEQKVVEPTVPSPEQSVSAKKVVEPTVPSPEQGVSAVAAADIHISDDDDDEPGRAVFDDDVVDDVSGTSLFATLVPATSAPPAAPPDKAMNNMVDQNEDLSTIPKAKTYADKTEGTSSATEPPKKMSRWSSQARKDRKVTPGAASSVRKNILMAPTVGPDSDDSDGEDGPHGPVLPKAKKQTAAGDGPLNHSLFSILPKPKNDTTYRPAATKTTNPTVMAAGPSKVSRPPVTATTTSMMPRTVKKAQQAQKTQDGGSDDEVPFFSFDSSRVTMQAGPSTSRGLAVPVSLAVIRSNPDASAPQDRPLDGVARPARPAHAGVYGPQPGSSDGGATAGYDDADDLMANRDQIERLQGKKVKRGQMQEELSNVIEVNQSDLTADPREWMKKAMQEDVDAPGPRNNIKGQTKRKHQITYLAAMAKEKEQELKKAWSDNAQARRAAGNKYGF